MHIVMQVTAYRAVAYAEALRLLALEKNQGELGRFSSWDGLDSAPFGQGVYLVSDPQAAASQASRQAISPCALLRQQVDVTDMLILDDLYGLDDLRTEVLFWRHAPDEWEFLASGMDEDDWQAWLGREIRDYVLEQGHSGILYHRGEITYYVCYHPQSQIHSIQMLAQLPIGRKRVSAGPIN